MRIKVISRQKWIRWYFSFEIFTPSRESTSCLRLQTALISSNEILRWMEWNCSFDLLFLTLRFLFCESNQLLIIFSPNAEVESKRVDDTSELKREDTIADPSIRKNASRLMSTFLVHWVGLPFIFNQDDWTDKSSAAKWIMLNMWKVSLQNSGSQAALVNFVISGLVWDP